MNKKKCFDCQVLLPQTDFYDVKYMRKGKLMVKKSKRCKSCEKLYRHRKASLQ